MTSREYNTIILKRASFRKKGLLNVLVCFFSFLEIAHNEQEKYYVISLNLVSRLSEKELDLLVKLVRRFSVYDKVDNGYYFIKYSWL